ncbi:hypothetical protein QUF80_00020 [Desulfococcaceae bacterium HSG8]|nr:hypothetical protein [Desulfococcaceae bacterium HSG8]
MMKSRDSDYTIKRVIFERKATGIGVTLAEICPFEKRKADISSDDIKFRKPRQDMLPHNSRTTCQVKQTAIMGEMPQAPCYDAEIFFGIIIIFLFVFVKKIFTVKKGHFFS